MKNINKILIIFMIFFSLKTANSQQSKLYQLGEDLLSINKDNNPDKIVNYIDPNLDLDKKAEIMESFLKTKDYVFDGQDQKNIKLFNVVKNPENTLFIIQKGKHFIIVKSKTNDQFFITHRFTVLKSDLSKKLENGRKIYKLRCYSCHRKAGEGGIGPNLSDPYWKFINSEEDLQNIIAKGKKGTMMIAFKDYLTPEQLNDVILYTKSLLGKKQEKPKKPEGEKKNLHFKIQ